MIAPDLILQSVLEFIAANPHLAILVVFLAAFSEAIPVLGALVPGTAIVLSAGALVGLGKLPLWPVIFAATCGAIVSDGLSYWFGHRYKAQALSMWPVSRYPGMLKTSEQFFARHGGKSVAIARFVPVVRAFIPLIAGTAGMAPAKFYLANVGSAIIWAPLHVLPGAAVGMSLGALGGMSGRTLALLMMIAVVALFIGFLVRVSWRVSLALLIRAQRLVFDGLVGRRGRMAAILRAIADPDQSAARVTALWVSVLAVAVLAFIYLVENVLAKGELVRADAAIANLVTSLRSEWSDQLMVFVTTLADTPITAAVGLIVAAWLWWIGRRDISKGLAALVAITALFALGVKALTHIARPNAIYTGAVEYSFPSGHVTFTAAIYGVLAWLIARDLASQWRRCVLAAAGLLIATVTVSRLYLGAHWPSDVTAGLLYGVGAMAVFAMLYRSAKLSQHDRVTTAAVALGAILLVGGWHVSRSYSVAAARYTVAPAALTMMSGQDWRTAGWMRLPARRAELSGEREDELTLQWAGESDALAAALAPAGWLPASRLSLSTVDRYLSATTSPSELPGVPMLNDGRSPTLMLVKPTSVSERLVLRAWKSKIAVDAGSSMRVVLVGFVSREAIRHPLGWMTISRTLEDASGDTASLLSDLPNVTIVERADPKPQSGHSGTARVVLAAP